MRLTRVLPAETKVVLQPRKHALLISPSNAFRSIAGSCLRELGFSVQTSAFGPGALRLFLGRRYRLVILDLPESGESAEEFYAWALCFSKAPCVSFGASEAAAKAVARAPRRARTHRPAFLVLSASCDEGTHGLTFLHHQLVGVLAKPLVKSDFLEMACDLCETEACLRAERGAQG